MVFSKLFFPVIISTPVTLKLIDWLWLSPSVITQYLSFPTDTTFSKKGNNNLVQQKKKKKDLENSSLTIIALASLGEAEL